MTLPSDNVSATRIGYKVTSTATASGVEIGVDIAGSSDIGVQITGATTDITTTNNEELTIESAGTGAITIGNDVSAESLNLGTGAGAKTLLIGSTNTTSSTSIQSGSGNISLAPGGSGGVVVTLDSDSKTSFNGAVDSDVSINLVEVNITATAAADIGNLVGLAVRNINETGTTGTPDSLIAAISLDANETVSNGLLIEQNATGGAIDDGIKILATAGSITDGIQIGLGTQTITNAINIASTGVTTDIILQNGEKVDNNTDDLVTFTGVGGTANTDLQINLDGASPTLSSPTATTITISDNLSVSGAINLQNGESIDNNIDSRFLFKANTNATVEIVAADTSDSDTPLTISSAGTGALTLDPTGAGSVAIGSADVTGVMINTAAVASALALQAAGTTLYKFDTSTASRDSGVTFKAGVGTTTATTILADGPADAALTIGSKGTGILTLDPTGAGSVAIGSADVTGITLTTSASNLVNVLTGNLKVGDGTPTVTLDGEDAYVEGTLEVDGAARFDGSVVISAGALSDSSVVSADIFNGTIVSDDLADGSVTKAKLSTDATNGVYGYMSILIYFNEDTTSATTVTLLPLDGDIVHVTFANESGASYTGQPGAGARLQQSPLNDTGANTFQIVQGSLLGDDGVESFGSASLTNNTGLLAGRAITFSSGTTTGTRGSHCWFVLRYKLNQASP